MDTKSSSIMTASGMKSCDKQWHVLTGGDICLLAERGRSRLWSKLKTTRSERASDHENDEVKERKIKKVEDKGVDEEAEAEGNDAASDKGGEDKVTVEVRDDQEAAASGDAGESHESESESASVNEEAEEEPRTEGEQADNDVKEKDDSQKDKDKKSDADSDGYDSDYDKIVSGTDKDVKENNEDPPLLRTFGED